MQVTRRRRTRGHGSGSSPAAPAGPVRSPWARPSRSLTATGVAAASTTQFRDHQVGTEYANGLQISDDQTIAPLGDRLVTKFGKFMGSNTSPDGRFLAASSTDKSVALQIFDLASYKLIYTVGSATFVNQKLADGTVGQEGPVYSRTGSSSGSPSSTG